MLRGTRVAIGPVVPEDFAPLFRWANDVDAARLDFAYRPVDLMTHKQWWDNLGKDPCRIFFAIRKTTAPTIIGFVQINAINSVHRSAELGIRIGDEGDRGKGHGKEALELALEFCWNHLNLNRVQLEVFKHNQRAIGAYRSVGFKKEGVLRKAVFIDGEWIDLLMMAILRGARKRAGYAARGAGPVSKLRAPQTEEAQASVGLTILPRQRCTA